MSILAVDLGEKRVGLAIGDFESRLASPLDNMTVRSPAETIERILNLIDAEAVQEVVVGVPLNMDGSWGPAARRAVAWGGDLARRTQSRILFVDERLSSFEAEARLGEMKRAGRKLTHADKRRRRDALAASTFLQDYLDGKLQPLQPPG